MDNPDGLKGSEDCKILSFLPNKMLSFSWNAPPQFKEIRESEYKTWVVINFEPISKIETRITLTHTGWPDNDQWTAVYNYFNKAWEMVLKSLYESYKDTE